MKSLKVLDTFSGIGGFALAAQMVGGFETIAFCEIEPYCQKVLNKNFPGIPIHDDIRTLTVKSLGDRGITGIDVITGGSPCQDLSIANPNGRGLEGKRSGLFFELMRVVRECRPRYIILENVANLLSSNKGRDMGTVLWELSQSGYDAEWQVVSAASVGAPHLRERVFVVAANRDGKRCNNRSDLERDDANLLAQKRQTSEDFKQRSGRQRIPSSICEVDAYANRPRREEFDTSPIANEPRHSSGTLVEERNYWGTEPGILRVDARVPRRVDRIKGLGNAVVPQVAAIALQRVLELDRPL